MGNFGICFKCKKDDVFINPSGLCNWCDSLNYFTNIGVTTFKDMQKWVDEHKDD